MPKKDNQSQGYYGFDPSGLERAATVRKIITYYSVNFLTLKFNDVFRPRNTLTPVRTRRTPSTSP